MYKRIFNSYLPFLYVYTKKLKKIFLIDFKNKL